MGYLKLAVVKGLHELQLKKVTIRMPIRFSFAFEPYQLSHSMTPFFTEKRNYYPNPRHHGVRNTDTRRIICSFTVNVNAYFLVFVILATIDEYLFPEIAGESIL